MNRVCNKDCPFFILKHLEDDGTGLSKIHFKCFKTNTEVIIKVRKFNDGYLMHDCPLDKTIDEDEDEIASEIVDDIQIIDEETSDDY